MSRPDIAALADDCVELADELGTAKQPFGLNELDVLVQTLCRLDDARTAVSALYGMVEREILARLKASEAKSHVVDGVTVERHGARKSVKTDAKLLLGRVVDKALEDRAVDTETGEAEPREDAVVRGLTDAYALDIASVHFRAGWMKAHGIDYDELQTWEWGPQKLQLTRPTRTVLPDAGPREMWQSARGVS